MVRISYVSIIAVWCWQVPDLRTNRSRNEQIRRRLSVGETCNAIATSLGLSVGVVLGVRRRARIQQRVVEGPPPEAVPSVVGREEEVLCRAVVVGATVTWSGPQAPTGCRWIDGEPGRHSRSWRYCQAPLVAGSRYCREHLLRTRVKD